MFENNSLFLETLMTLIAKLLQVHRSYSQLCFSTYKTLFFSNKLNSFCPNLDLISVFLISYQQLNKPLRYTQRITNLIMNLIDNVLSWKHNRNFLDIKEIPPSKIFKGRCVKPSSSFFERNKFFKSVFL